MKTLKAFFSTIIKLTAVAIAISVIAFIIFPKNNKDKKVRSKTDYTKVIYDRKLGDSIVYHQRNWLDLNGNMQSILFSLPYKSYQTCVVQREKSNYYYDYNKIYNNLIKHDLHQLTPFLDSLGALRNQQNRIQFANSIVSFIQNIEYKLILNKSCNKYAYPVHSNTYKYLNNCTKECCYGFVKYGVHSPMQFLHSLAGDCDTRTVLLYGVLSYFGYDVLILNSNVYHHSILGVNLPSFGYFKKYLGKKYYTWETTNINWRLGEIAPAQRDMKNWFVVLPPK